MRRPRQLLVPVLAGIVLLAAACGDDETDPAASAGTETSDDGTESSGETGEPAETESADSGAADSGAADSGAAETGSDPTASDTGPPEVPVDAERCEDVPDPAEYPEGELPQALRPCAMPTELVVQEIRPGSGREAAAGDTLYVDYAGIRSEDGLMFDASYTRGVPIDFVLGRGGVIPGWDEGFIGAQAGELLKLDIPTELAYGNAPPGDPIQPGDALTFIAEVRAVIPPTTHEDAPFDIEIEPSVDATEVTTIDVEVGDGPEVEVGDTAIAHVMLRRGDNEVLLYNSWDNAEPLPVSVVEDETIPGLFQGLQGMRVGGTRVISMPPEDAFGDQGDTGLGLPPDTDLIIVVQVLGTY